MIVMREQDKHFLWSLFVGVSVILMWKGIWDGLYEIPYIGESPWIYLFIGFAMLTFSGVIFKEFDPLGGLDKATLKMMHFVHGHPHKKDFQIKYYDKSLKKEVVVDAANLKGIEKQSLLIEDTKKKQEVFVPMHRVTEVIQRGKSYWRM